MRLVPSVILTYVAAVADVEAVVAGQFLQPSTFVIDFFPVEST